MKRRNILLGILILLIGACLWRWQVYRSNQRGLSIAGAEGNVICLATLSYLQDHGGRFPDEKSWRVAITPYLLSGWSISNLDEFSLSPKVAGKNLDDFDHPCDTPMILWKGSVDHKTVVVSCCGTMDVVPSR